MIQEHYKKLSKNEIAELKQLLEEKLKPILATVKITNNPIIIHMGIRKDGSDWTEWDEYRYGVTVECQYGNFKFSQLIYSNAKIEDIQWDFMLSIWDKLIKIPNFDTGLANTIWKK